jgi:hypothetical protein
MTDNQDSSQSCRAKKVAVIAVHGISDQKPYASARAIVNLLLAQTDPTQSTYTPFNERFIRVKVAPVKPQAKINIQDFSGWNEPVLRALAKLQPQGLAYLCSKLWVSADERGPYVRRLLTGKPLDPEDPLCKPDYLFMRDQIEAYKHRSIYDSICLEGQCTTIDPHTNVKTKIQVDIYEMYWADLSRLPEGFIPFLAKFSQLLSHLSILGRQCINHAQVENQSLTQHNILNIWQWYSTTQALASRIISLILPTLNLFLLVVALMNLPGKIPFIYINHIASITNGILLTLLVGCIFLIRNKISSWIWLLFPFCVGLFGAITLELFIFRHFEAALGFGAYKLLAMEWAVLLCAAIWFTLVKWCNFTYPGTNIFTLSVAIPLGLMTLNFLFVAPNSPQGVTLVSLHMIEVIYLLMLGGWLSFLLLYFATLVIEKLAIFSISQDRSEEKILVKQASLTAHFTLAVSSLLYSSITMTLWIALSLLSEKLLPEEKFYKPLLFLKQIQPSYKPADFAHRLTVLAGSAITWSIVIGTLLAIVLFLLVLLPSLLTEKFTTFWRQDYKNVTIQGFGNWLSHGSKLIIGPVNWIICIFIPVLFLVWILDEISLLSGNSSILSIVFKETPLAYKTTDTLLTLVAGFLTVSISGLIAFGERLNKLSLGLRGILDAVLDIDNYLCLHPRDSNSAARIFARYSSLLRYLCSCPDEETEPYDAFIIVAHSQGTVISADLLRFLKIDPDPALAQIAESNNIYLFTMGSPLRQLYSYLFPHRYHWVNNKPSSTTTSLEIPPQINPSPQALFGVRIWVNTFRSGDYVGRYLWRSDRAINQWLKVNLGTQPTYISEDPDRTRREFCLGGGAHTHYWDFAPEVAQEIDRLIREA